MAGRDVTISDGGKLNFVESASGDGVDAVSLSAPASVTSYSLQLPASVPATGAFLKAGATSGGETPLTWNTTNIGYDWVDLSTKAADPTDASAGLNTALDSASATTGPGVVYVPGSNTAYQVSAISAIDSSAGRELSIVGSHPERSILKHDGALAATHMFKADDNLVKRFELRNLTIDLQAMNDAGNSYQRDGYGLMIQAEELVISNCIFQNIGPGPAIRITNPTKTVLIENCLFRTIRTKAKTGEADISATCISVVCTDTPSAGADVPVIAVKNCHFVCDAASTDAGTGAVALTTSDTNGSRNYIFEGNYLHNCGSNPSTSSVDSRSAALVFSKATNVIVKNNIFDYITGPVMDASRCNNLIFDNNLISSEQAAAWNTEQDPSVLRIQNATSDTRDIQVTNNVISKGDSSSLQAVHCLDIVGASAGKIEGVKVTGNKFEKTTRGVNINHCYGRVEISDNEFSNLRGNTAADSCIKLDNMSGQTATGAAKIIVNGNSTIDCLGRFFVYTAQTGTTNERTVRLTNNNWVLDTTITSPATPFASTTDGEQLCLIDGTATAVLKSAYVEGNRWSGSGGPGFLKVRNNKASAANVVYVKDVYEYGAVGDGTANDQRAIQQALTDLGLAGVAAGSYTYGGGTVVIPRGGRFKIAPNATTDGVTALSNCTITGGGTLEVPASYENRALVVNGSHVIIKDISIECGAGSDGAIGIDIGGTGSDACIDVSVLSCNIGTSAAGFDAYGVRLTAANRCRVDSCNVFGKYPIVIWNAASASSNNVISNNVVSATTGSIPWGIGVVSAAANRGRNNVVSNNSIISNGSGVVAHHQEAATIIGNSILSSNSVTSCQAIYTYACLSSIVSSNSIIVGSSPLLATGIHIDGASSAVASGNTVSGNTISPAAIVVANNHIGIKIGDYADYTTVIGNSISNMCLKTLAATNDLYVIQVIDAKGCQIIGNTITAPATHESPIGIKIHNTSSELCKGASIIGNSISLGDADSGGRAIVMTGDSATLKVTQQIISNNQLHDTVTPLNSTHADPTISLSVGEILSGAAGGTAAHSALVTTGIDGVPAANSYYINLYPG